MVGSRANAIGQPWQIEPAHVGLIATGLLPIMPGWVDKARAHGFSARIDMRIRRSTRFMRIFKDGSLTVDTLIRPPIDAHVSSDATAFLLVFYKRRSLWRYVVAGKMLAWGRRPWVALSLPGRFHNP